MPNPISGEAAARVKENVERAVSGGHIRKIVLDFNPNGQPASTSQFGPCLDLAKFLERQHQVSTIAFVRARTTRHTVLPVLACREVVMASDASLGDILPDQAEPPDEDEARVYARMAGRGREALVLKMLDKNVVLLEGRTPAGAVWYLDGRKKAEAEREGIVAINPLPLLPAGARRCTPPMKRGSTTCASKSETRGRRWPNSIRCRPAACAKIRCRAARRSRTKWSFAAK